VRIRNDARYFDPPIPRLLEHEAMHQKINRVEAARLEKELAAWSAETTDLREAAGLLRRRFKERLESVRTLHKEWDANSVFAESPGAPR
jgi:hypothetical protein